DVNMLREVQRLSHEGVSLEGIKRILELKNLMAALQRKVSELTEGAGPRPSPPRAAQAVVIWRPRALGN
ncbi:MAG TPA: heat-shock protein, partial [Arthrobacter bacterium]|nr:heat-shock protein [Arthrobacter sp.]